MTKAKKKVYVCFDYDNDKTCYDFIIGQAKNPESPFEVANWSLKEEEPEKEWLDKAQERIRRCDVVFVMVGEKTFKAPGVLKEVKIAKETGKPIFQIICYRDSNPTPVPGAGPLHKWNWILLEHLLS